MSAPTSPADLPKAGRKRKQQSRPDWRPDPQSRFVYPVMADALNLSPDKPTAFGTPLRLSDSGKCSRLLGYQLLGIARSNPMDTPAIAMTGIGTTVHEIWQRALKLAHSTESIG